MGIQRLQPVSSGTDWSKGTSSITKNSTSSTTNVELLNISGKGILTNLIQFMDNSNAAIFTGTVDIIVDGSTIISNLLLSKKGTNSDVSQDIIPFIPFSSSLVIKHKTDNINCTITTTAFVSLF